MGHIACVYLPRWVCARSSIEGIVMPIVDEIPSRFFYSPAETERLLGISHATCYRLIAAGKLDARHLGGKTLITSQSIERLIAELPKVGRQT
jgi:excisionase family DNA binding protein